MSPRGISAALPTTAGEEDCARWAGVHTAPMTRWFRNAIVALAAALGAMAADGALRASRLEIKKEVVTVIEAQLAAFRKGDAAKAYTFAAADLRAQKPLPVFTTIVKENYPEIWSNTRAEFGIVRDNGMQATVIVQVYSKAGDAAYDFTLAKERAGWRIYGVVRHAPKQKA
jgi:hypothetical protein